MEPVKLGAPGRIGSIGRPGRQAPALSGSPSFGIEAPAVRAADVPTLITMARSVAAEGPPVNEALVMQLRAALADGSYRIDPDRIAKAMTAFFSRP